MNSQTASAQDVAAEMQLLYDASLPELLARAKQLIESLPAKSLPFAQQVFFSTVERLFILVQDISNNYLSDLEAGYFTTAGLTRSLLETATLLALFNRDQTAKTLSAFLEKQEKDARKRRESLARLRNASNSHVASAAQNETRIADGVVAALKKVRLGAGLPVSAKAFPDMAGRCRMLGEHWEFIYHAVYRDLCEAVHGAFLKTPHAPTLAFASPNRGAALIYEHSRTFGYAVEFWGCAVLDCCVNHSDTNAVARFREKLGKLIEQDHVLLIKFPASSQKHTITF